MSILIAKNENSQRPGGLGTREIIQFSPKWGTDLARLIL